MIVSTKIAKMFKHCGFVNVDYLVENRLERNPSKILNILNRDWRKWVKPLCMFDGGYSLDPNFGYETKGDETPIAKNGIKGSGYTCPQNGIADSITVWVKQYVSGYTPKMKCALYLDSDLPLLGTTEEWTQPEGWDDWKTFNFSTPKPSVDADTVYGLVIWGDDNYRLRYTAIETYTIPYYSTIQLYNSFPDPFPSDDHYYFNFKYSIYCTYTAAAPPPKPKGTIAVHAKVAGII